MRRDSRRGSAGAPWGTEGGGRPGERCDVAPWGATFLNLHIFSVHKRKFSVRKKPKQFFPRNQNMIGDHSRFSPLPTGVEAPRGQGALPVLRTCILPGTGTCQVLK